MRLRSSVRIAIATYLVILFIGLVVTLLASNARSDAAHYWKLSRGLGLRRESLQSGYYPGMAFVVVGVIGAYRCLNASSSRHQRRK
jgi:hypothetical protein